MDVLGDAAIHHALHIAWQHSLASFVGNEDTQVAKHRVVNELPCGRSDRTEVVDGVVVIFRCSLTKEHLVGDIIPTDKHVLDDLILQFGQGNHGILAPLLLTSCVPRTMVGYLFILVPNGAFTFVLGIVAPDL